MIFSKISLKWNIFRHLLLFTVVLLVILWLSQIVFLNEFYRYVKTREIKQLGQSICYALEDTSTHGFTKSLETTLEGVSNLKDVNIEIVSKNNEVMLYVKSVSERALKSISILERQEIIEELINSNSTELIYRRTPTIQVKLDGSNNMMNMMVIMEGIDEEPREGIIYAKILKTLGREYIVLISTVITPITATVSTLKVQLYFITIIMILFSIGSSLIIAKRVSRPIETINKTAKNLGKGNFNINFPCYEGYKEICELSNTLNYATKELSKVENLRRELIANISHDLRTPLTLISGYAEVMRDLPDENTPENASVIIDETNRLTRLVNDLLDFSKFQACAEGLNLTTYNLTESLQGVIKNFNELIKKDGYKINFIYNSQVLVHSDEIKINQVFYNLLSNAVNYAGENKTVDVFLQEQEDNVIVNVTDYGEGIDEENLPYIWDRYYKIDKVHKRAITGTGIGLSIVKSILERCPDATYGVHSKVGYGTTFYFSLKIENN